MSSSRDSLSACTDTELAARIRAGESAAFQQLFLRHAPAVLRFAASLVSDRDVAEDLMQDVFGWVWLHRAEWAPPGDVLAYLLRATRHRALNRIRNARVRTDASARASAAGELMGMGAPNAAPDQAASAQLTAVAVQRLLAELPEERRTVLLMRWRHRLSWDEIAAALDQSVAAVKKQHSRTLAGLRARLASILE